MQGAGLHEWDVVFYFDGKTNTVSSISLKLVANEAGTSLNKDLTEGHNSSTELVCRIILLFYYYIDQKNLEIISSII